MEVDFYIKSLSKQEILNLLEANNEAHYEKLSNLVNLDTYSEKLSKYAINFTCYQQDKLVGLCACYFNDDVTKIGYISGISFLNEYRSLGLGSKLIRLVIEYAKENSFKEINITPDCNNNVLINFLEKNGFLKDKKIANRCLLKYTIKEAN
jgi:ribosomal protein S18 acetylase RimI-like enzyme